MTWKTALANTKAVVGLLEGGASALEGIIQAWDGAPPEVAELKKEAFAYIGRLQNSLQGALDRADLKDLERPLDD